MQKLINIATKGLTGIIFVVLLAVNVQIGTGSSLLGIGESSLSTVKAAPCDFTWDYCYNIIYPNGEEWARLGEPIVVTPDEEIARQ
jgi:hypothetical protein